MPVYLLIDILCIVFPLVLSFDRKIQFRKKWNRVFLGIFIMMSIFIPWDIIFTIKEYWGFNKNYLSEFSLLKLPIEEWLFFICIGFACGFTHEVLKGYFPVIKKINIHPGITLISSLVLAILAIVFFKNWYTLTALGSASILLSLLALCKQGWLGTYLVSYAVITIPFLIINGWLTGSFTEEPIVWYNNQENLSIRVFTIPLEDFFYNFTMLGIVIWALETKSQKTVAETQ